jgi:RNA polymerase sigma factor (sigma-70 family)
MNIEAMSDIAKMVASKYRGLRGVFCSEDVYQEAFLAMWLLGSEIENKNLLACIANRRVIDAFRKVDGKKDSYKYKIGRASTTVRIDQEDSKEYMGGLEARQISPTSEERLDYERIMELAAKILTNQEYEVLSGYASGVSNLDMADVYGVGGARISQIKKEAVTKLRRRLRIT